MLIQESFVGKWRFSEKRQIPKSRHRIENPFNVSIFVFFGELPVIQFFPAQLEVADAVAGSPKPSHVKYNHWICITLVQQSSFYP